MSLRSFESDKSVQSNSSWDVQAVVVGVKFIRDLGDFIVFVQTVFASDACIRHVMHTQLCALTEPAKSTSHGVAVLALDVVLISFCWEEYFVKIDAGHSAV